MIEVEGVYLASKTGTLINLVKAGVENERQSLDYFTFQSYLFRYFDVEKSDAFYLNVAE